MFVILVETSDIDSENATVVEDRGRKVGRGREGLYR